MESVLAVENLTGKKVVKTFTIKGGSDFDAYNKACVKVGELGFNSGSMQRNAPIGIAKDTYIPKWYNIPKSEYPKLSGLIISDDFRNGDVCIYMLESK